MRKNNAVAIIGRIRDQANKLIVRELENHGIEGIVPSHGDIMVHLFAGEKYTMRELAEKINRSKPTVTVLVEKLADYGYVAKEKSTADSRVTFISLTAKGLALKPAFDNISAKLNALVYKSMSEAEAEALEKLLARVDKNLREN